MLDNMTWDGKEAKITSITPYGKIEAVAKCHPDDEDLGNEYTGLHIASQRMLIKSLQIYKHELKIRLSALNQLYYSMKHSSRFNDKSYENKMLQRQINLIKTELNNVKQMIEETREKTKEFIDAKDDFYKTIRANRKKKEGQSE